MGGQAFFLGRCDAPVLLQRLHAAGVHVLPLESVPARFDDLQETLAVAARVKPDWIVLDGYRFEPDYQETLHRLPGARLLVVDDMAHWPTYHADVILNQNLGAADLRYFAPGQSRLLMGTQYALLRREFMSWPKRKRVFSEAASKLLITLGGSGSLVKTSKMMEALDDVEVDDLEARIVVWSGLSAEALTTPRSRKWLRVMGEVSNMPELMAWADVAVIAGGSTCLEATFMGLPSLVTVLGDNQWANAEGMAKGGVAVNLGRLVEASPTQIAQALKALLCDAEARRSMSAQGQLLVDGRGVDRVLEALRSYSPASVSQ